jgi:hypothetical protein
MNKKAMVQKSTTSDNEQAGTCSLALSVRVKLHLSIHVTTSSTPAATFRPRGQVGIRVIMRRINAA